MQPPTIYTLVNDLLDPIAVKLGPAHMPDALVLGRQEAAALEAECPQHEGLSCFEWQHAFGRRLTLYFSDAEAELRPVWSSPRRRRP